MPNFLFPRCSTTKLSVYVLREQLRLVEVAGNDRKQRAEMEEQQLRAMNDAMMPISVFWTLVCCSALQRPKLGCGFPVNFEFPPLPGKPSSVCLATEFA